jgi:hypothetical protein
LKLLHEVALKEIPGCPPDGEPMQSAHWPEKLRQFCGEEIAGISGAGTTVTAGTVIVYVTWAVKVIPFGKVAVTEIGCPVPDVSVQAKPISLDERSPVVKGTSAAVEVFAVSI